MRFASEVQSQYRPLADEYPMILTHLCLATNNACGSNSSLHQLEESSAGPGSLLPAGGNDTTFRFLEQFLAVRKDKIAESQKITRDQL